MIFYRLLPSFNTMDSYLNSISIFSMLRIKGGLVRTSKKILSAFLEIGDSEFYILLSHTILSTYFRL